MSPSTRRAISACSTASWSAREASRSALETVSVDVPEAAVEAYEAALESVCATVGFFVDETTGLWRVEGVREIGRDEAELVAALALAAAVSGCEARL